MPLSTLALTLSLLTLTLPLILPLSLLLLLALPLIGTIVGRCKRILHLLQALGGLVDAALIGLSAGGLGSSILDSLHRGGYVALISGGGCLGEIMQGGAERWILRCLACGLLKLLCELCPLRRRQLADLRCEIFQCRSKTLAIAPGKRLSKSVQAGI